MSNTVWYVGQSADEVIKIMRLTGRTHTSPPADLGALGEDEYGVKDRRVRWFLPDADLILERHGLEPYKVTEILKPGEKWEKR